MEHTHGQPSRHNGARGFQSRRHFLHNIGLAAAGLTTWGLLGSAPGIVQAQTKTLRVGFMPILDHLALVVSHARDNTNFQNVQVEPVRFTSFKRLAGDVRDKRLDAAFMVSPLATGLFTSGVDVRAILLAHRDGSAITVKKGSGIRSAQDLRGKVIAVPDRQATHVALLGKYLEDGGVPLEEVTVVVIAPKNMEVSLKNGYIDAFIVAEPFGTKAQNNGVGEILILTKNIMQNHVECIVIARQESLEHNPIGVQEWVSSLVRAGKFIDEDKMTNGAKGVADIASREQYLGHKPQLVIGGLQNPPDRIMFSNLNPVKADFAKIVSAAQKAKILEQVDLHKFVDDSFYKAAIGKS